MFYRNQRLFLSSIAGFTVFAGILLAGWWTQKAVHVQIRLDVPMPDGIRICCRTAQREGFGEAKCTTVPTSGTPAVADVFVPAHQLYGLKLDFGSASGDLTILGGIVGDIPLPPWIYWSFSSNIIVQGDVDGTLKLQLADDGADHYMQVSFRRPILFSSRSRILSWERFILLLPLAIAAALATGMTFLLQSTRTKQKNASFTLFICILSVIVFFFLVGIRMASCGCDMGFHITESDSINIRDLIHPIAFWKSHYYPMWHLLVKLVKTLFKLKSSVLAAGLANGLCYNVCLIEIYLYLRRNVHKVDPYRLIGLAFAVCTVGCMFGPKLAMEHLYANTHNAWWNPTNTMVNTFALPCVLMTAYLWDRLSCELSNGSQVQTLTKETLAHRGLILWLQIMTLGLLLTLTELAKPSFIQAYLPAMFLFFAGWFLVNRKSIFVSLIICSALIAPCLIVFAQYFLAFDPDGGGGIGFGFGNVASGYDYSYLNSFYAIAFPIVAFIVAIMRRRVRTEDIICWLMLLTGLVIAWFLFERGPRMTHGNLGWGFKVALFLVWIVGVRQYADLAISQNRFRSRLVFWTLSILLVLHALTGFWKMYEMMCLGRGL